MSGDKSRLNGSNSNGVNGSGSSQNNRKGSKGSKDKDGDDEMTVVVPPSKGSNKPTAPNKATEADLANGADETDGPIAKETPVDPKEKAITGMWAVPSCRFLLIFVTDYPLQTSRPTFLYLSGLSVNLTLASA
jgi:hypothetical protein